MGTTVAKTYRLPTGLYSLISQEAETLKTTEADVVRQALRQYFSRRQEENALLALEARLSDKIDMNTQRVAAMLREIISLAQNG